MKQKKVQCSSSQSTEEQIEYHFQIKPTLMEVNKKFALTQN